MRIALSGLLVALSCYLLWGALAIGGQAAVYPAVVAGGAALFTAIHMVKSAVTAGWPQNPPYAVPWSTVPRVIAFVVIWSLYVIALPRIGFMAGTWLALVATMVALGTFRLIQLVWYTLFVGILAVLLKIALYVPVPQGWLDTQLEIFLYSLR